MCEATFRQFFRSNLDLHNLDIEKLANILSNPHVEHRKNAIPAAKNVKFEELPKKEKDNVKKTEVEIDEIGSKMSEMKINPFNCSLCKLNYPTEAQLKKHITTKHPETHHSNPRECPVCGQICASDQRLKSHMVTHLRCSICKTMFT